MLHHLAQRAFYRFREVRSVCRYFFFFTTIPLFLDILGVGGGCCDPQYTHTSQSVRTTFRASHGETSNPRCTMRPSHTNGRAVVAMAGALCVLAVATAAVTRERRRASRVAQAKSIVRRGVRVLLAVDIGSSSVRCSAYTVGSPPVLVPGCAVQLKHAVVKEDGTADAEQVISLVDAAVDKCFG